MLSDILRPKTLQDVIGQDSVVKILKEQIKNNKLSNVLFFIGNSGCGKTTLATIIATTLSCDKPIMVDGVKTPCGVCDSCKDIIEERLQKNVSIYNGADITADAIRELESSLHYTTLDGKPRIIIINEAQLVKELKRLLEIIETTKEDVYFIFTSTDKSKFSNTSGKDNKSQETQALRSRGSYFNIRAFNTKDISDYLFSLLEKVDPDEKIPDTFIEEGIPTIASNCHGNIRQAINDFGQCIDGEIYTEKEISNLLGYEDEKEFHDMLYKIATYNTEIFSKLEDVDIAGFFNYSWTILTSVGIKKITNEVCKEQWKEKTANALLATNNVEKILKLYENVYKSCNGYFNEKVFYNYLINYYNENTPSEKIIKKVKKIDRQV